MLYKAIVIKGLCLSFPSYTLGEWIQIDNGLVSGLFVFTFYNNYDISFLGIVINISSVFEDSN